GDLAGLAVGVGLGGVCGAARGEPGTADLVGQEVEVSGPTLDGKTFRLEQLRGKVVLVDFWATWCPPCVKALPELRALRDRHGPEGFEIVGVSLDIHREDLARFVRRADLPWPQIYYGGPNQQGGNNPLARRFGVRQIPDTLLIDRQGRLVAGGRGGKALDAAGVALLEGKDPSRQLSEGMRLLLVVGGLAGWLLGVRLERGLRAAPAAPGGRKSA